MPSPRAFLQAFGLHKQAWLGHDCILSRVTAKHVVVEKYRRYTFPLTLDITTSLKSASQVLDQVQAYVDGHRTVLSDYGNPYDCFIGQFAITSQGTQQLLARQREQVAPLPRVRLYRVTCLGYGNRIAKPTQ